MAEEVRVGLIGAGRIARVHAQAYERVAAGRLVACADVVHAAAHVLPGAKQHSSPDNATVILRHATGAMSSLYVSWTTGYGNFFSEAYGTKGSISLNFLEKQVSLLYLKEGIKTETFGYPAGWNYPDLVWSYGYAGEQQYFIDQILGRAPQGKATGEDGRAALEVVLAAQHSLDMRRVVELGNH